MGRSGGLAETAELRMRDSSSVGKCVTTHHTPASAPIAPLRLPSVNYAATASARCTRVVGLRRRCRDYVVDILDYRSNYLAAGYEPIV